MPEPPPVLEAERGDWGHPPAAPVRVPGDYYRRIEASRGCRYGRCTFCVRPVGSAGLQLTPLRQVRQALADLERLGVREFTFTDEDILGTGQARVQELLALVAEFPRLEFSASVRVGSVLAAGSDLLESARSAGLTRAFVGIESLSDSQLKRFGKGTTATENLAALDMLRATGIKLEAGFILFDPGVTVTELQESITIASAYGLAREVGTPFGWMRIEPGSPWSKRRAFRDTPWSPETLEIPWRFASEHVGAIFSEVRRWWDPLDPFYSAARNMERTDALPVHVRQKLHDDLTDLRLACWDAFRRRLSVQDGAGKPAPAPFGACVDEVRIQAILDAIVRRVTEAALIGDSGEALRGHLTAFWEEAVTRSAPGSRDEVRHWWSHDLRESLL